MKRYSILQEDFGKKCYICGDGHPLHTHEVFYGTANRQKSIMYGCCISLCPYHHNFSSEGIHFNKELDLKVKKEMQQAFIKKYPQLDFIKIFGRSYL